MRNGDGGTEPAVPLATDAAAEDVVARLSVPKVVRTVGLLVALGGFLLLLALTGWGGAGSDRTLLFGFSGVVFLVVAALLLSTLRRGSFLAVTDAGIEDNVSKARRGFIPWHDVSGVSTRKLPFGQKALAIHLRAGASPASQSGAPTQRRPAARGAAGADVTVALSLLDLSERQLLDAIERKRERYQAPRAE